MALRHSDPFPQHVLNCWSRPLQSLCNWLLMGANGKYITRMWIIHILRSWEVFFPHLLFLFHCRLACAGLKRLRNNTAAQHSITPVFSLSCVKKKTETKNMIFYLGVVVVDKSATNLSIFNYSTCYVATVVAGNETADGNEVWTCGSILLYVAARRSRRVALSAAAPRGAAAPALLSR